ncbi:MAG: hypothetical protein U1F35_13290 [Steroidobacteraceae bacterium]
MTLLVSQYGAGAGAMIPLNTFAEAGRLGPHRCTRRHNALLKEAASWTR